MFDLCHVTALPCFTKHTPQASKPAVRMFAHPGCAWLRIHPIASFVPSRGPIFSQTLNDMQLHPLHAEACVSPQAFMQAVLMRHRDYTDDANAAARHTGDWQSLSALRYKFYAAVRVTHAVTTHASTCPQTWQTLRAGDYVRPAGRDPDGTCICARVITIVRVNGFRQAGVSLPPLWQYDGMGGGGGRPSYIRRNR
jgi:hypothetical protein